MSVSDSDTLAQLARVTYREMNVEPRQMHRAIELAREQLAGLRRVLEERGLRRAGAGDSAPVETA